MMTTTATPGVDADEATARPRRPRILAAVAGAVAAALALGVTELLAGLLGEPSLVARIGDAVIDLSPGSVTSEAIDRLGTADKPALAMGIVVLSLCFGAVIGLESDGRRWLAAAGFGGFALVGVAAANRSPLSSTAVAAFIAVVGAAAGIMALRAGLAALRPGRMGVLVGSDAPPSSERRAFLVLAGIGVGVSAISAGIGRRLFSRQDLENARAAIELPSAHTGSAASVEGNGLDAIEGITSLITPNDDFYLIDTTFLTYPSVNPDSYELKIDGMVDNPLTLSYQDLLDRATEEHVVTLSCVSNEVGGDLVGSALWQGVLLEDLLSEAGVQDGATQIVGRSVDNWTGGFPTDIARDGRPAMVAIAMNGEPLPVKHGFPARLVIPGLYGYVSATKWLAQIELTTWDAHDGYWIPRGWDKEAPILIQSRIDVPRNRSSVTAGETTPIAGVAWSGIERISRVEVRIDGDEWLEAELGPELSAQSWRQWTLPWEPTSGVHALQVRAFDGQGNQQIEAIRSSLPNASTGYHTIEVQA